MLAVAPNPTTTPTSPPTTTRRRSWIRGLISRRNVVDPYEKSIESIFVNGDDKDICDYIRNNPECCQRTYSFDTKALGVDGMIAATKATSGGDGNKLYPLLVVCGRKLSVETIQTVYEANPKAVDLTLHYACSKQASLDVIQFLVSIYPDGARAQINGGWLPLHKALSSGNGITCEVIEYLLECHPQSIQQRISKTNWKLPLHIAIQYGVSLDVVKLLVSKYPKALEILDYEVVSTEEDRGWIKAKCKNFYHYWHGGLPLHHACRYRAKFPIVQYLIKEYPHALRTKNHMGWLPLHYACNVGASIEVIEAVVVCCPNALLEHTFDYRYPVDLCWGRRDNTDYQVVQYLISKHPMLEKPLTSVFRHYIEEANLNLASERVTAFFQRVHDRSIQGYTFVSTREDKIVGVKYSSF